MQRASHRAEIGAPPRADHAFHKCMVRGNSETAWTNFNRNSAVRIRWVSSVRRYSLRVDLMIFERNRSHRVTLPGLARNGPSPDVDIYVLSTEHRPLSSERLAPPVTRALILDRSAGKESPPFSSAEPPFRLLHGSCRSPGSAARFKCTASRKYCGKASPGARQT